MGETENEATFIYILTMFPYSHEVLLSLVAAPNAEFVKAMQLQQPTI